jgi:hypothetical protein
MKKLLLILVLPLLIGAGCTYESGIKEKPDEANNDQWFLKLILCSERSTEAVTIESKDINCEADNLCKLIKFSNCPTCQDVIYKCVEHD